MKEDGRREILLLVKGREGGSTGRYEQAGDYLSKTMLAYEYRTCQDKVKRNLEVIGGAGIAGINVAAQLGIARAITHRAVEQLIARGDFRLQLDGRLHEPTGTVLKG